MYKLIHFAEKFTKDPTIAKEINEFKWDALLVNGRRFHLKRYKSTLTMRQWLNALMKYSKWRLSVLIRDANIQWPFTFSARQQGKKMAMTTATVIRLATVVVKVTVTATLPTPAQNKLYWQTNTENRISANKQLLWIA